MAKTITLKDPVTREPQYPVTIASNVYDENGNIIPTIYATKTELSNYFNKLANFIQDKAVEIGTWIDGRTIYRIVYYVVVSSNSITSVNVKGLGYNEAWIDFGKSFCQYDGAMTSSGVTWCNQPTTNSDYGLVYINNSYQMNVKNNSSATRHYYITLNYTK